MELGQSDTSVWGWAASASAATYAAVRWWYHVRKLHNADKIDGGVTSSL